MVKSNTNEPLSSLESTLNQYLGKDAPLKLPENIIKLIVQYMPWISVIIGALYLFSAWGVWSIIRLTDGVANFTNALNQVYGTTVYQPNYTMIYVSALLFLGLATVHFLAYKPLTQMKKEGWNYLFYAGLASIVVQVVSTFAYRYDGSNVITGLISGVISALIQFFFLFQIRSHYTK
jgi:hypothetical protein